MDVFISGKVPIGYEQENYLKLIEFLEANPDEQWAYHDYMLVTDQGTIQRRLMVENKELQEFKKIILDNPV